MLVYIFFFYILLYSVSTCSIYMYACMTIVFKIFTNFFFISNRFTQIWIENIHIFYDCPFWWVFFIFLSHFEVFWIMWVHEMCSVNKSIQSYIYIRIIYVTLHQYNIKSHLSMKLKRKTKAAGIFCKLFDFMGVTCIAPVTIRNWSCTPFWKLCYTCLYSLVAVDFIWNCVKIQILVFLNLLWQCLVNKL